MSELRRLLTAEQDELKKKEQDLEMVKKEKELESKVRKPAEAEKYRLEKIGKRTTYHDHSVFKRNIKINSILYCTYTVYKYRHSPQLH